ETTWEIGLKAHTGAINVGIAGGVDTNSDVPIEVSKGLQRLLLDLNKARSVGERLKVLAHLRPKHLIPNPPTINEPRTRLSMGEHCELMVKEWKISREAQDEYALASHHKAAQAYEDGFFHDLVTP